MISTQTGQMFTYWRIVAQKADDRFQRAFLETAPAVTVVGRFWVVGETVIARTRVGCGTGASRTALASTNS